MPKVKESESVIAKLYRRSFSDQSMFFFVMGQKSVLAAMTTEKALYNYFRFMGIDEFNIESAMTTITRMQRELFECEKT